MRSKVKFDDIIVLEDSWIARIWCVMCRTVIPWATSGESQASFQAILTNQFPCSIFQFLANLNHCHAGLDKLLYVFARLTMRFGSLSQLRVNVQMQAVQIALFLARETIDSGTLIDTSWHRMFHYLTLGVISRRIQMRNGDCWGICLFSARISAAASGIPSLFLLGLLLFLICGFSVTLIIACSVVVSFNIVTTILFFLRFLWNRCYFGSTCNL